MYVSFSISGVSFDIYSFVSQTNYFPKDYNVWDEEISEDATGVTLIFDQSKPLKPVPFSLGRFLLGNRELLKTHDSSIEKELTILIEWDILAAIESNTIFLYELKPKFMGLLSELGIKLSITKTIAL